MFKGDGNKIAKGEIFVDTDNRTSPITITHSNLPTGWTILSLPTSLLIHLNPTTYISQKKKKKGKSPGEVPISDHGYEVWGSSYYV